MFDGVQLNTIEQARLSGGENFGARQIWRRQIWSQKNLVGFFKNGPEKFGGIFPPETAWKNLMGFFR